MIAKHLLSMLAALFLCLGTAVAASAVTLTVGDATIDANGGTVTEVSVDITVDDPSAIAGASFTITYDTSRLTLARVTSTFFATFAAQFATIAPTAPTEVTVDGTVYDQPLIKGDEDATLGGTMIAAARVQAGTGAANAAIFTLVFDITDAINNSIYPVNIEQSVISNTDAGYDAGGETIPYLVGADETETDLTLAFPEITVDGINGGTITVTNGPNSYQVGDVNKDGAITAQDAVDAFWLSFQGSWSGDELLADYNGDGAVTAQDAVDIFWASFL